MAKKQQRINHTAAKNRLITKLMPKSPISEQFRAIRTNIHFSEIDSPIKTIVVSSAGPGEGKTTTISNLAVVFAQQSKKVLLIDADMRKPMQHHIHQVPNTLGLTNVLTKQVGLNDAIRTTDVEGLYVLTSGPIPPNPAELIASGSMDQLIKEVSKQFDLVLIDTPPVLAVTDAQLLANKVDASILVVMSGKTDRDGVVKAKEVLANTQGRLLGAILNNLPEAKSMNYYYYNN